MAEDKQVLTLRLQSPDPLARPLRHIFSQQRNANVLSSLAVVSVICFIAGVALLGSSHAAGFIYTASIAVGIPVFLALRPWEASVPRPAQLYAVAVLALMTLFLMDVVFRDASTTVLDRSGRLVLGFINGFFFYLILQRERNALYTLIVLLAAAHASTSIIGTILAGVDPYTLRLIAERLGGHAERAIPFAMMHMTSIGIVVLAMLDRVRKDRKYWLLGAVAGVLAASLVANMIGGSRGPLLAMPLLLLLAAAVLRTRLGPAWAVSLLIVGAVGFVAAAGVVFQRDPRSLELLGAFLFGQWGDAWIGSTAGIRLELWRLSLQVIPDALLFGHGHGAFSEVLLQHGLVSPDAVILKYHPHNEYLNLLVQIGIVGTALFFAPMAIALSGVRRLWTEPATRIHAIVIAWVVGAHLIFGLTDIYSEWSTNCLFLGVFLGMLIWLVPDRRKLPS